MAVLKSKVEPVEKGKNGAPKNAKAIAKKQKNVTLIYEIRFCKISNGI